MDFDEVSSPVVDNVQYHPFVDVIQKWKDGTDKGIYKDFKNDFDKLSFALQSYLKNYKEEFNIEHDYFKLRGEDNIFRYIPLSKVAIRISAEDTLFEVMSRIIASKVSKVSLHVSIDATLENSVVSFLYENKDTLLEKNDVAMEHYNKSLDIWTHINEQSPDDPETKKRTLLYLQREYI